MSINEFDASQLVQSYNKSIAKNIKHSTLSVGGALLFMLLLTDLFEYLLSGHSFIFYKPKVFFGFLLVIIAITLFQYLMGLYEYKITVGSNVFKRYATHLASKGDASYCFNKKETIEIIISSNGKTYKELSVMQKAVIHQAIADNNYMPEWLLDKQTLKDITTATNNIAFKEIINSSRKIIDTKEKTIRRRFKN